MRVVYVAARFTAPDGWTQAKYIRSAEVVGMAVAEAGAMPLMPTSNTRSYAGTLDEKFWYAGTLELLRRCDAMILTPGWNGSRGVAAEIAEARLFGIPVFERVDELKTWLQIREEVLPIPAQRPENGTVGDSTVQGDSSAHLSSGAPPSDSFLTPKETA